MTTAPPMSQAQIWLMHVGEPVSFDGDIRPFRYGMLSEALESRGAAVARWAPTFAHHDKSRRAVGSRIVQLGSLRTLVLQEAGTYRRHVGPRRQLFHERLAFGFSRLAADLDPPDLVLFGLPAPEWAAAVSRFCFRRDIPFVIDVRDTWPDPLLRRVPPWARPFLLPVLIRQQVSTKNALRRASDVVAISHSYLDWAVKKAPDLGSVRPSRHVYPMAYKPTHLDREEVEAAQSYWRHAGLRVSTPQSRPIIASFVGVFSAQFDFEILLDVIERIQDDRVVYVLAGDGPFRRKVEARAAKIGEHVIVPGWIDNPELTHLLNISHIGLAPYAWSSTVSLPNKPFEYIAHDLILVAPKFPDLYEQFGNVANAFLYDSSEQDLARKLQAAICRATASPNSLRDGGAIDVPASQQVYGDFADHLLELIEVRAGLRDVASHSLRDE